MNNSNFGDFWTAAHKWSIQQVTWNKGVRRQIRTIIEISGFIGVTCTEIARIAKWKSDDAMSLIEFLVAEGAMVRRHDNVRRYIWNPYYNGNIWAKWFTDWTT